MVENTERMKRTESLPLRRYNGEQYGVFTVRDLDRQKVLYYRSTGSVYYGVSDV